jgi:hypothetical protein
MTTKNQIAANRKNAAKSTGPKTPKGKAKVSQNALRHGLATDRIILPGEEPKNFEALLDELAEQFQPATAIEHGLIRQIADAEWRLRRIPYFEASLFSERFAATERFWDRNPERVPEQPEDILSSLVGQALIDDSKGADPLSKLSRYETRLTRSYFRALDHLQTIQQRRQALQTEKSGPKKEKSTKQTQFQQQGDPA